MTKQEYEQAMKIASEEWDMDSTDSAMVSDWTKPKDQYIASLEADRGRLEKAVEYAVGTINDFTQFCPYEYHGKCMRGDRCVCRKYVRECWKQYLMGDE